MPQDKDAQQAQKEPKSLIQKIEGKNFSAEAGINAQGGPHVSMEFRLKQKEAPESAIEQVELLVKNRQFEKITPELLKTATEEVKTLEINNPDGQFGQQSREALEKFKEALGSNPDGEIGQETQKAMGQLEGALADPKAIKKAVEEARPAEQAAKEAKAPESAKPSSTPVDPTAQEAQGNQK